MDQRTKVSTTLSSLPISYDTMKQVYRVSGLDWIVNELLTNVADQENGKVRKKNFSVNSIERNLDNFQGAKMNILQKHKRIYVKQNVEFKTKIISYYYHIKSLSLH